MEPQNFWDRHTSTLNPVKEENWAPQMVVKKRTNLQIISKNDINFACAQFCCEAEQVHNGNSRIVLLDCESSIHSHNFYLRPFKKAS